jgi:TolB protein
MTLRCVALLGVVLAAGIVNATSDSTEDWQTYTDRILGVTFRCPKQWKVDDRYYDAYHDSYLRGPDGHVSLEAAGANTPLEQCQEDAGHKLQPFGTHPTIRSMKIQGLDACLVWPSDDQEQIAGKGRAEAELVVRLPRPVEIGGDSYPQLELRADPNHISKIAETLTFIAPRK